MPWQKYGTTWPDEANELTVELYMFRETVDPDDKYMHFHNVVNMLWNDGREGPMWDWHPWAVQMSKAACANKWLSIAGCGGSGKSFWAAGWAIVNWLCAPDRTMVICTSTEIKAARKRIWGSIVDLWEGANCPLPGKLVNSLAQIRYVEPGSDIANDKAGISLIASEKKKDKDSMGKMIGLRAPRVLLIADELSELSHSVLNVAYANLSTNEWFSMVAMSNPDSYYDPFGQFSKPVDGWESVTELDYQWQTQDGLCIRIDASHSPNVELGEDVYPYLPRAKEIEQARRRFGENSREFYRMFKGFWAPSGLANTIYSETEILRSKQNRGVTWRTPPIRIAGFDPSFSRGGDRSLLIYGWFGITSDGQMHVKIEGDRLIYEDVKNVGQTRTRQVINQVLKAAKDLGIAPRNFAMDASGAGAVLADGLEESWSREILRVHFAGSASDMPASVTDKTPAKLRYTNRMSELWYAAKGLLEHQQITGITEELAKEMTTRLYDTVKQEHGLRIQVESKKDMKMRTGKSPDIADAMFVMLELCRQRLRLAPASAAARNKTKHGKWTDYIKRMDVYSRSEEARKMAVA